MPRPRAAPGRRATGARAHRPRRTRASGAERLALRGPRPGARPIRVRRPRVRRAAASATSRRPPTIARRCMVAVTSAAETTRGRTARLCEGIGALRDTCAAPPPPARCSFSRLSSPPSSARRARRSSSAAGNCAGSTRYLRALSITALMPRVELPRGARGPRRVAAGSGAAVARLPGRARPRSRHHDALPRAPDRAPRPRRAASDRMRKARRGGALRIRRAPRRIRTRCR